MGEIATLSPDTGQAPREETLMLGEKPGYVTEFTHGLEDGIHYLEAAAEVAKEDQLIY